MSYTETLRRLAEKQRTREDVEILIVCRRGGAGADHGAERRRSGRPVAVIGREGAASWDGGGRGPRVAGCCRGLYAVARSEPGSSLGPTGSRDGNALSRRTRTCPAVRRAQADARTLSVGRCGIRPDPRATWCRGSSPSTSRPSACSRAFECVVGCSGSPESVGGMAC